MSSSSEMEQKRKFDRLKLRILLLPNGVCSTFLLMLLLLWRDLRESDGTSVTEGINVALRGIANQSSTFEGVGLASKAIDGSLASNYLQKECSHTDKDYEPWWAVDLLDTYHVAFVAITSRGDFVNQRLNGSEIQVWGDWYSHHSRCATIFSIGTGETRFYPCGGLKGRYVAVVIPGRREFLTLCEVQVFTLPLPGTNIALLGTANQSSTAQSFSEAGKAIDGSLASNYSQGQCSSTDYEYQPWWAVDLLDTYPVTFVAITNRGDAVSESISGAEIQIWDTWNNVHSKCGTVISMGAGETSFFSCGSVKGRYVAVVIPEISGFLTLCEVQVFTLHPPIQKTVLRVVLASAVGNALETPESQDLVLRNLEAHIETHFAADTFNLTRGGYHIESQAPAVKEETKTQDCLGI
ncbi:uncharacterized protein LOC115464345 [Microcaecilia unicolor]|uniref:Uncharacterized protein LOC115464345 n=1 Tax=Microcaecilia unicolor TaxID=1415580 RepID=A0A6P7XJV8_9AMPH|nr:uncharacterized protein LOC115464345 [Microcaecilia unicolor]